MFFLFRKVNSENITNNDPEDELHFFIVRYRKNKEENKEINNFNKKTIKFIFKNENFFYEFFELSKRNKNFNIRLLDIQISEKELKDKEIGEFILNKYSLEELNEKIFKGRNSCYEHQFMGIYENLEDLKEKLEFLSENVNNHIEIYECI